MSPNYEQMLEAMYRSLLKEGDTAIDVGAHIGRHTLPMAQAVGTSGCVHAFEPLPSIYPLLVKAVKIDPSAGVPHGQVLTHNVALGETAGTTEFVFVPDCPEYSGFKERTYHDGAHRTETIKVEVAQLDSLAATLHNVRFVKVDAEGGELAVMRGAINVIRTHLPVVSFELGDSSLTNYSYNSCDYYDFFSDLGYQLYSIFGVPLSRNDFIVAAAEQFFWDYIAIPPNTGWTFGHNHMRVLMDQVRAATVSSTAPVAAPVAAPMPGSDSAQQRLEAVLNSASWRITAPLRRIAHFLGVR
jgi:FkbM family methyltransferase